MPGIDGVSPWAPGSGGPLEKVLESVGTSKKEAGTCGTEKSMLGTVEMSGKPSNILKQQ